ncbi:MAG: GRAM domain-containing protein [Flammeovirgaceae bacterium]
MKVLILVSLICNLCFGQQSKVIYKQRVLRDYQNTQEIVSDVVNLRSNAGVLYLTEDSLFYKSKNRKSAKAFDFRLSYCEIELAEKLNYDGASWGGLFPNRIQIIANRKVYRFGTHFKRKKIINLLNQKIVASKEYPKSLS